MKWLIKALLVVLLTAGMLLNSSLVVYADDGEEDEEDEEEEEEEEGTLTVDIVVVGDNPDVSVDVIGEDAMVTLNTTGTEIYLDGQNINKPIIKTTVREYYVENPYNDAALKESISNLEAFLEEAGMKLDLTGKGLAKVILVIGEHTDSLHELLDLVTLNAEESINRDNELATRTESQDLIILQLGDELTVLKGSLEDHKLFTSESLSAITADYQTALANLDKETNTRVEDLRTDYDTKLFWTWGSLGVIGLLLSFWKLWQIRLGRD